MKFFFTQEVSLSEINENQEMQEYQYIPEIAELSDKLKSCLQVKNFILRNIQFDLIFFFI